jgi:hypothetical protein
MGAPQKLAPDKPVTDPPDYGNASDAELEAFRIALGATAGELKNGRWTWRTVCPRCRWEVLVELERILGVDAVPTPRVACHCTHNHLNRPAAVNSGCGFDVTVQITPPQGAAGP